MKAYTRRRLLASAKLGLAAVPFGVALRALQHKFLPAGVVLGFGLGFSVGVAELFLLRSWFRHAPFVIHIVAKSVLITGVLWLSFAVLNVLDVIIEGITWTEYARNILDAETLLGLLIAFCVIAFLLFFVQLDRLLGPGVLLGYVTGRYHHPRREQRIFMFLDLEGSTALADGMDANRYFEFLHESFSEMSEPILEANAEIYQYVGDEVVLTWRRENALEEANCIRAYFLIEDRILAQRERFLREYGAVPAFRAGVHGGEVITAQIGELKKEIVYNGDVMNTTSRIQAKCGELGHRLLVSADVLNALGPGKDLTIESVGPVPLRGKSQAIELFAVRRPGVQA